MSCKCNCYSSDCSNCQNIRIALNNTLDEIDEKIVEANTILEVAKSTACIEPDYEDINLNSDGELQSADRQYNTTLYVGKGWKILRRKEVIPECNCCCKKECRLSNVLTQEDCLEVNTIYVVRYNFDLGYKRILLPKGCEIRFEGGSFSNGEIDLNCGKITGMMGDIDDYFKNVTLYNFCQGQLIWKDNNLYIWVDGKWKIISTLDSDVSPLTLDDIQEAINKGSKVAMAMPSENNGMLSLPFKTMTLSEYNNITPVDGITYNII